MANEKKIKTKKSSKKMGIVIGVIFIIIILIFYMWTAGAFKPKEIRKFTVEEKREAVEKRTEELRKKRKMETIKPKAKTESMEYMLATIEKGYVSRDDIIIARFRSLLQQLDSTYIESKKQIGDMTVTAQNLLRNEGIKESLLNIMEGMNGLFSKRVENQSYAEYTTAYIVLRKKGQSHYEAIAGLKALLESLGIY